MSAVTPIEFVAADGVVRQLRWTLGARKAIKAKFGHANIWALAAEHGDEVIPELAHFMMHDEKGNPPDITVAHLDNTTTPEAGVELFSKMLSACTQGKQSPNEILDQLTQAAEAAKLIQETLKKATNTGSESGPSADTASDSPTETSGTDSSNAKLTLLEKPIESKSDGEQS